MIDLYEVGRKIYSEESDFILSKIDLKTLEVQYRKKGRPFRASSLTKLGVGKYINGTQRFCWEYSFRYLDVPKNKPAEFFKIRLGYNDEIKQREK
jgi:hypothetical protein